MPSRAGGRGSRCVVAGGEVHRARARSPPTSTTSSDDDAGDGQPAGAAQPPDPEARARAAAGRRRGAGSSSCALRAPRRPTRPVRPTARAADGSTRSGWIASASARSPSPSRGPGRVTMTSSIGRIVAVLDGGQDVPAGPRGDLLGRHAVGGVAEQDRPRDRTSRIFSGSIWYTPSVPLVSGSPPAIVDHLGAEVVRAPARSTRSSRRARRTRAARRGPRSRPSTSSNAPWIVVRRSRRPRRACRPPARSARCRRARVAHVRREDHDGPGCPAERSFAIDSGGLKLRAAGDDEVGARGDDLLDVDASRTWRRRGRRRPRAGRR